MRSSFRFALPLALLLSAGCDDPPPRSEAPSTPSAAALDDLGYTASSRERHPESRSGVVHRDPERSSPGYNLYTDRYQCQATLIDSEGVEVARWQRPEDRCWSNVQLLPDGDVLVIGWERGPTYRGAIDEARYLLRLSWSGEERWKTRINAHHDLEITPEGKIALLAFRCTEIEGREGVFLREDLICLLSEKGEQLDCRSLQPALAADEAAFRPDEFKPSRAGDVACLDPVHANSVEFTSDGNVLLTMRHQDAIMMIRWETGELLWSWGREELEGPHDATVLENGNILIFDNGLRRGWSRVVELDPLSEIIVWEYRATPPESFYSASRGSSQRLPGGNTLIAESDEGRAFEVTPEGEIVWSWINPTRDEEGRLATLVRMKRLPVELIAPLLE
jgi:hypothetical protein